MIIKVKDIECDVEQIIKRRNKNIYLRVRNKKIYITTPSLLTVSYIQNMITKNYNYIYSLLNKEENITNNIHFLGKKYNYEIIESTHNNIFIDNDIITIFTRKNEATYIKRILHLFYGNELKKIVDNYIFDAKKAFNIDFDIEFNFKNVKSYFGECYHKRKLIILATKLAKYDLIYILSVLYHELAHFYYQNHSKNFYDLLEKVFPKYKQVQKNLKKIKYNDIY